MGFTRETARQAISIRPAVFPFLYRMSFTRETSGHQRGPIHLPGFTREIGLWPWHVDMLDTLFFVVWNEKFIVVRPPDVGMCANVLEGCTGRQAV